VIAETRGEWLCLTGDLVKAMEDGVALSEEAIAREVTEWMRDNVTAWGWTIRDFQVTFFFKEEGERLHFKMRFL
jgi:hypothetical protein